MSGVQARGGAGEMASQLGSRRQNRSVFASISLWRSAAASAAVCGSSFCIIIVVVVVVAVDAAARCHHGRVERSRHHRDAKSAIAQTERGRRCATDSGRDKRRRGRQIRQQAQMDFACSSLFARDCSGDDFWMLCVVCSRRSSRRRIRPNRRRRGKEDR